MKFLATILSVYILLLVIKPCTDRDVVVKKGKQEIERNNHTPQQGGDDFCSPFCICNCCGVHIVNFTQPVFAVTPFFTFIKKMPSPVYKSVFATGFFGSIWQPPQIA